MRVAGRTAQRPFFMAKELPFLELPFPKRGINLAVADIPTDTKIDPGDFCDVGKNVRLYESLTERGRGGQRSGLSRYIDQSIGSQIQHLNTIVRTDGAALGFAFQGTEFEATGLYLGLDLTTPVDPTGGGGGYQPSPSFDTRYNADLTVSDPTVPADGTNAQVVFTVVDRDNNPAPDIAVQLYTYPGGRVGNHLVAVTDSLGIASFTVNSTVEETVRYLGAIFDGQGEGAQIVNRSRNAVEIQFGAGVDFIQARSTTNNGIAGDPDEFVNHLTLAYSSNVTLGDFLLVGVRLLGAQTTAVITDTQGNVYTQIGAYVNGMSLWGTFATATGANTVTGTWPTDNFCEMAILEYSGVGSVDSTATNSGVDHNWTTGSVSVSQANGAVAGFFFTGNASGPLSDCTLTGTNGFTTLTESPPVSSGSPSTLHNGVFVIGKQGLSAATAATGTQGPVGLDVDYDAFGVSLKT